jgi:hypothetical protein
MPLQFATCLTSLSPINPHDCIPATYHPRLWHPDGSIRHVLHSHDIRLKTLMCECKVYFHTLHPRMWQCSIKLPTGSLYILLSQRPMMPCTTNWEAYQVFLTGGIILSSSSWHCSICHICSPENMLLFIFASDICGNMKHTCLMHLRCDPKLWQTA